MGLPGDLQALALRRRLLHRGRAARIEFELDRLARRQRPAPDGGGERRHPGLANLVAAEVQRLQLWHRARLDERRQGRGGLVAHLVVAEVEPHQLLQPAALVGRAERPDQGDPLRVAPLQAGEVQLDRLPHLLVKGLVVDGRHQAHVALVGEALGPARHAVRELGGKRLGRHRRLARAPAVVAHIAEVRLPAGELAQADEGVGALDHAARPVPAWEEG